MAAVTIPRIKRLVQLHRRGIPGAQEQFEVMLQDDGRAVCESLGLPEGPLSVGDVISRVEDLTARARSERQRLAREEAERVAGLVGAAAQRLPDRSIALPIEAFCQIAASGGFEQAMLRADEHVGVVDLRVFRQFLRTCRDVELRELRLTERGLSISYKTAIGSGRISLVVGPASSAHDAVMVGLTRKPRPSRRRRELAFFGHFERALQEVLG